MRYSISIAASRVQRSNDDKIIKSCERDHFMPYTYDYPRPAVTVDAVVFTLYEGALSAALVERGREPFAGRLALPGGYIEIDEDIEDGARRELAEETGLVELEWFDPFGFFGAVDRDPRGRTISLAFVGFAPIPAPALKGGDDAASARWTPLDQAVDLAFDHDLILEEAVKKLVPALMRSTMRADGVLGGEPRSRRRKKNKIDLEAEEKIDQYQDAMRQAYERFLDKKKFRFSNMFRPKNDDESL